VHHRILVQSSGDAERVPGAVGEVRLLADLDFMLRRHPGEGWCHTNGFAIRLEQKDAIRS
jgi:hypothetical protein